tara:strand:+ start:17 stop:772 length:756 start_codon:yes stop_codon:yes gene_type:complete
MTTKKALCIIPCFNEEKRINALIKEISDLDDTYIDWLILNNGSTDNTFEHFKNVEKYNVKENILTLNKEFNTGYGSGIKFAITSIFENLEKSNFSYKFFIWTHADGQTPLRDVLEALKIAENIKDNKLIVKGKRKIRKDGLISKFFEFFLNTLISICYSDQITNPYSQPTLVTNKLIKELISKTPDNGIFDFSILIKSLRLNVNLVRFPVIFYKRENGFGSNENLMQKIRFSIFNLLFILKNKNIKKSSLD